MVHFDQIVGQELVLRCLRTALEKDLLPHAYLFVGPEGVGRETTARAFFWLLLCEERKGCGQCRSCQKYQRELHPDVEIIKPEGKSIRIEQIRALEVKLFYRPLEAERRLILLPQAQLMTREAANALLKSLEEPPPYNLFILIADKTESLLPTIVSRCQIMRFRPLPQTTLARLLEERFQMLPEEAEGLSLLAEGSVGRALHLAEKGLLEEISRLVLVLKEGDPVKIASLAEILAKLKDDLVLVLELILVWLRQSLYAEEGLSPYPASLPPKPPRGFILPAMERIQALFGALERNLNPEILFLSTLAELSLWWKEAEAGLFRRGFGPEVSA